MADQPLLSLGPLLLNQADRDAYAAGQLKPWLQITQQDIERGKQVQDPRLTQFENTLIRGGANITGAVLNPWENLIKPAGSAVKAVGSSLGTFPLIKNTYDALAVPVGELEQRKVQQQQLEQLELLRQQEGMQARIQDFNMAEGGVGTDIQGQSAPIVLGPAPGTASRGGGFGVSGIPMPPAGPDYSGVQNALDQTKPDWDEAEFEKRRKSSILSGLIGGLLSASLDSDKNFAQILGAGGLGVLSGMAQADKTKADAKAKFKAAMDDYWIKTAGVRQNQAESDANYAQRVWETKVQQMELSHKEALARAAANATKTTIQNTDKGPMLIVEETVNTPQGPTRQVRAVDLKIINRLAGMDQSLREMFGGVPDAEKKVEATIAEVALRKDRAYALPLVTLARLKSTGTYLDAINFITQTDPDIAKEFTSSTSKAIAAGMPEAEANKQAESRRDALLLNYFMHSPPFRAYTLDKAGLLSGNPNLANQYSEFLERTGR